MNCNPTAGDGHYYVKEAGRWVCCTCGTPR